MKNNKSIYIVGIFMLVTMVSIGYAILSGQLNINGKAKIKAAKWDIYFTNVKEKYGSVAASVKPSISNKTTVNFEVNLNKPGDFYEFNVDVVNDGMIDAMIESINITPELTIEQQKYLSYLVTYLDDVPLEEKDILHAKKLRTLKVRVEYLKNVENNELNSSDENLNINVEIKYSQADVTAKIPTSNELELKLINVLSGNGTNVGDEIAIGDEHFYVIKNDGENIAMLAKYNLDASSTYDSSKIYKQNTDTNSSPIPFNATAYWGNVAEGTYVYNDNASIKTYVDNYKSYLEILGMEIKEARLIKKEEVVGLGCPSSGGSCKNNGAPEWVYSTGYWTGSANDYNHLWRVAYSGNMYADDNYYVYDFYYGVRPVIVISADSI